jgi:methylthioribulose-1-phosphate dehydratase
MAWAIRRVIERLAAVIGPRLNAANHAYLIRGHGVYVWGESMEEAERHLEALDYLFNAEILERQIVRGTN